MWQRPFAIERALRSRVRPAVAFAADISTKISTMLRFAQRGTNIASEKSGAGFDIQERGT
jgi:hypothetical protein